MKNSRARPELATQTMKATTLGAALSPRAPLETLDMCGDALRR